MESGLDNIFSDMCFGGQNIHLVWIQFSLYLKWWKLKPIWVSDIHEWVHGARHLQSLSRIWHLRFLVSRSISFHLTQICTNYFWFWKLKVHKYDFVNIRLGEITVWPRLWFYGLLCSCYVSPTDSWQESDNNSSDFCDGLYIALKHWLMYQKRTNGISCQQQHLEILDSWQCTCTAFCHSKPKKTSWQWSKSKYEVHFKHSDMCFHGLLFRPEVFLDCNDTSIMNRSWSKWTLYKSKNLILYQISNFDWIWTSIIDN